MKRSKSLAMLALAAGLFLSGCGKDTAKDALGDGTMLGVPLGETVSVDLDGDGSAEEITVKLSNETEMSAVNGNTWRFAVPVIRVGEDYFDAEAMSSIVGSLNYPDAATWFIMDVDTSDGYREIAVSYRTYAADVTETALLRYHGGELIKIGTFPDTPLESLVCSDTEPDYENLPETDRTAYAVEVPGDGTISGITQIQIIQTDSTRFVMRLENVNEFQASLIEQRQEYYEFLGAVENPPVITTRRTLNFYKEKDGISGETVTVPEGTEIAFLRYYPEEKWIEMKYGGGDTAWFKVEEFMDTIVLPDGIFKLEECFANLILGG